MSWPSASPSGEDNIFICDPELNFVRQDIADFHAYWDAKRGSRQFPARADIVPREIVPLLPWLHMHDVVSGREEFCIRLIGTTLSETFGKGDMRGEPISVLPPKVFERVRQAILWVLEARAPIRTYAPHAALPGQNFQGIESCFAPLSSNDADIDVIIAVSILENRH